MKFGVSLTGFAQQPAGTDMRRVVGDILEYVKEARALGFDFVYQGQHYLTDPYLQLQNLPFLARVAAEAEGMGIVATQVVPLLNPVDLAERCATMDVLTGGKFVLSAALGYRDQEYAAFNVDRRTRVSRMVECLEVVKRLWTEDTVNHRGSHFTLDGARMPLKPLQKPHPPIWIAANSDTAVVRAARLGYTWYVNPHATYSTIKDQIELYRLAGEEAGTERRIHLSPWHGNCSSTQTGRPHTRRLRLIWEASTRPTPAGGRTTLCLTTPSPAPSGSCPGIGSSSAHPRTVSPT